MSIFLPFQNCSIHGFHMPCPSCWSHPESIVRKLTTQTFCCLIMWENSVKLNPNRPEVVLVYCIVEVPNPQAIWNWAAWMSGWNARAQLTQAGGMWALACVCPGWYLHKLSCAYVRWPISCARAACSRACLCSCGPVPLSLPQLRRQAAKVGESCCIGNVIGIEI